MNVQSTLATEIQRKDRSIRSGWGPRGRLATARSRADSTDRSDAPARHAKPEEGEGPTRLRPPAKSRARDAECHGTDCATPYEHPPECHSPITGESSRGPRTGHILRPSEATRGHPSTRRHQVVGAVEAEPHGLQAGGHRERDQREPGNSRRRSRSRPEPGLITNPIASVGGSLPGLLPSADVTS